MANELRDKKGRVFWSDECADALAAINFALDYKRCDDALAFLHDWREGNIADWPEFLKFLKQEVKFLKQKD